jgi:hypothetical protein
MLHVQRYPLLHSMAWYCKVRTRSVDKVHGLNSASKAAFESNNTQFDNMNERLQRVEGRFDRLERGVQSILTMLQTLTAAGIAPASSTGSSSGWARRRR